MDRLGTRRRDPPNDPRPVVDALAVEEVPRQHGRVELSLVEEAVADDGTVSLQRGPILPARSVRAIR